MRTSWVFFFMSVVLFFCAPAFAVQTGGAGAANPVVITGAITAEGYSKAPTLEITSRVLKIGGQTYTWPSVQGAADSFLKDSGSGALTWEAISGTVPEPTAAGSLLVGTDTSGSWQSHSVSGDIAVTSTGVTTIAAEAVTGDKLANIITKVASDDANVVGISIQNTGVGDNSDAARIELLNSDNNYIRMVITNPGHPVPSFGNTGAIASEQSLGVVSFQGSVSLLAEETKVLGRFSEGNIISHLVIDQDGVITASSLPSSLYVKTTADQKLTAEALSLDGVSLDEGKILVGNDSDLAAAQSVSGDISITSTGVTTIAADAVTTAKIAAGAVTTAKISDEAVTSSKLANQILKSGTLDDAAYSLTFSNEGTGTDIGLPLPMSSYVLMRNSKGTFAMGQIPSQIPDVGGIGAVYSDKFLILASDNVVKLTAPELQFTIDAEGGNIRFVNDIDSELDVLTVDQGGVITAYSLPPSLYVKTTTDQKLTAEAIDISSGITGTLEIQYGGTGISSYPPSGEILIGDGTNYNLRIISGDVSMNYLGEVALRDGRISTSKLASNFILPINRGGTGITTTPMGPQILLGYMGSYSLRTVSGDVTMDYLGNYTIGSGKITADKLASNFTLPVDRGGTSVQSFTQHGIVYAATATSLDSTAAGSAGTVLKGTGSAPEFGQVVTAEIASGAVTTPKLAGNIDINTTGSISTGGSVNIGTTLEAGGRVIYTPSGTETITEVGGVTEDMLAKKVILIAGDGSGTTDISANPQIAAGSNGQMIILIGTNDSNLVKFDNGNGLQLSAATSFTLGIGDILQLVYVESLSKWVEISRTDN